MRPLSRGEIAPCMSESERLQLCAALANTLSRIVVEADTPELRDEALLELLERATPAVSLDLEQLLTQLDEAAQLTRQYARLLKLGNDAAAGWQRLMETPALAGAA